MSEENKNEEMSSYDKAVLHAHLKTSKNMTKDELKESPLTQKAEEILDKKGITVDEMQRAFEHGISIMKKTIIENQEKIYDKIDDEIKDYLKNKYDLVAEFVNGYARVGLNGKWGFIDTKGKEIVKPIYDFVGNFDDREFGTATVFVFAQKDKDGSIIKPAKWGFVNTDGTEYDLEYHEGMAAVNFYVGSPKLDDDEVYAPTLQGWGFVNENGELVIPFKYQNASEFENGKAEVRLKSETFFIDKQGNRIG